MKKKNGTLKSDKRKAKSDLSSKLAGKPAGKKQEIIYCKKCGTEIHGAKLEDQYTKKEVKTFIAFMKIQVKHPDWTGEECWKELQVRRLYWNFMAWKRNHPDEYEAMVDQVKQEKRAGLSN